MQNDSNEQYQGIVALEQATLTECVHQYFRQSEQLPTRLLLTADDSGVAGLMLQKLPGDEGDEDGWNRACALFDTLRHKELADTDAATVLHRLFHEEGVQLVGNKTLDFACSCSQERVAGMLQSLGREEAFAAAEGNDGQIQVRCEFCAREYHFSLTDLNLLFTQSTVHPAGDQLH